MKKEAVSTTQRDHVFEMVKLSVECILAHHERTNQVIGPNILARLVLTALSCPGFTEKQKVTLMTVSGIKCPTDMEKFVYYPVIDEQDDLETRALKMADIDSVFMPVHDFIKFDQEKMKLGSSKLPIRKLPTFLFPNEAQTPRSNRTATMYPSPPLDSGKLGLKFSYNEAVSGTLEENEKVPASRKESKSKIIAPPVKDINVQELEAIILELKKEKAALQKALSVFVMP